MTDDAKVSLEKSQAIRRQDLIELGEDFKKAIGPIGLVIQHLERTNKAVAATRRAAMVVMALVCVVLVLLFLVSREVKDAVRQIESLHERGVLAVGELETLTSEVKKTRDAAERVEDKADKRSSVQLVPETDPEKAKTAPMKIVIETPSVPSEEEETTVEAAPESSVSEDITQSKPSAERPTRKWQETQKIEIPVDL